METHGGFDINTGRDMHREKIQERKLNITKKQKKTRGQCNGYLEFIIMKITEIVEIKQLSC